MSLGLATMKRLVAYFVAFYLSFWGLGQSIPGLGLSAGVVGTAAVFIFSPILFVGQKLHLRHQGLLTAFVLLHVVLVNPFELGNLSLKADLIVHIGAAFLFFVLVLNLVGNLQIYSRMIGVLLGTAAGVTLVLVYLHLFVYQSQYLTGHLTYNEYLDLGREGKNTLAFFLALLFPFAYARFTHHRGGYNLSILLLVTFGALYTISRMALLSLISSVILFALWGTRGYRYRRQMVLVGLMVLVILPVQFGIEPLTTFLKLRSPAEVEEVESGERGFVALGGHRYTLLLQSLEGFATSPIFGRGLGSSRQGGRSESHNDYARILYEFGLVGLLLFGSIIWISFRDLRSCKELVPPEHKWLLDGQVVALIGTFLMLLLINAYDSLPVWFILAGSQIIPRAAKGRVLLEAKNGDIGMSLRV